MNRFLFCIKGGSLYQVQLYFIIIVIVIVIYLVILQFLLSDNYVITNNCYK